MSHYFVGETFDQIYRELVRSLINSPQYECSPRGQKIKENLGVTLVLKDPRARLISAKSRKMNYGFTVGEFVWYWTGRRDLEMMLYYNKRMKDFSDDGVTLNSAYGYRLRKEPVFLGMAAGTGKSQWETCVDTLVNDPDSRRAVMLINRAEDERFADAYGSKDVPCTLSLQFFVRENRLELHVTMRSNDAVWGLCSDLFSFTLFQEMMLLDLKKHEKFKDLELGSYVHHANSMHIYERHFELGKQIVEEYDRLCYEDSPLNPPMSSVKSLDDIEQLIRFEEQARLNKFEKPSPGFIGICQIDPMRDDVSKSVHWMASCLWEHRLKKEGEKHNV